MYIATTTPQLFDNPADPLILCGLVLCSLSKDSVYNLLVIYDNSAKNTAMFIIRFERNAKDGLKPKLIMKNDNSHLDLALRNARIPAPGMEEEKKSAPAKQG